MASLLSVPTEVFYYYAKYLDLLDFGALLFTCKGIHDRLHEDLVFKKCIFDHSPFTIKNPRSKSSVRRQFIEYNAKLALRKNDPDSLLFYFPTLSCDSILQQLRQVSPELQQKLGRANLLPQIDAADADKVLAFIIESFVEGLTSVAEDYYPRDAEQKKSAVIIELLFMLGDQFLKPTTDMEEIKRRPEKKTTLLVLDLFKKFEDHAWVKLVELSKKQQQSASSVVRMPHLQQRGAQPYMRTLFYFQEKYPEFKFNVNHPMGQVSISSAFINGSTYLGEQYPNMTVADYAVACQSFEMLEVIVDLGGKLSEGFPHFWRTHHSHNAFQTSEKWHNRLMELGADLNVLRDYDKRSYLYYFLESLERHIHCTEHIKKLVAHGARFTKDEENLIVANRLVPKYSTLVIALDEIKRTALSSSGSANKLR